MTTIAEIKPSPAVQAQAVNLRYALGIALSVISGLMILFAFPPYGAWPLIWFAFIPYRFAQHRLLPRKWSGLAAGLAMLFFLGPYLARLFGPDYGPFFQYLGVWIAILVFLVGKDRLFHERTKYRWFVLQGTVDWVGWEMIRATFIPLVATNGFIAYTQATQPWLIQPVSIFSVYGLGLVICLFNYALTYALMAWYDRKYQPADAVRVDQGSTRRWLAGGGIVTAAWVVLSLILLAAVPDDSPKLRAAALMPDYSLPAFQDTENLAEQRLETFTQQIREATRQGAQVIFTPEMGFDFDPRLEHTAEVTALAKESGAYIFFDYAVAREGEPFRNESVLISPQGEFLGTYAKNHAAPGEPLSPGAGAYPVFDTPLGKLATLICHDANYTDVARRLKRNGAELVSAGFREFGGYGGQLWTNAVFRAVENRTGMVVTGVATVAAIINSDGSLAVLKVNPDGERITLVGDVSLGFGKPAYQFLGDWLGWAALVVMVFFMGFDIYTGRRARQAA